MSRARSAGRCRPGGCSRVGGRGRGRREARRGEPATKRSVLVKLCAFDSSKSVMERTGQHLSRRGVAPGDPASRTPPSSSRCALCLRRGAADGGTRDRRRHDGGRRAARRPASLTSWATAHPRVRARAPVDLLPPADRRGRPGARPGHRAAARRPAITRTAWSIRCCSWPPCRGRCALAKSGLFRHPLIAPPFLALARALPVYRRQDADGDTARNAETFRSVSDALARGGAIVIFPEGVSQRSPP